MSTDEIKILHAPTAEDPFVVLYKPHGMPSAPLVPGDNNSAFSRTCALFPELSCVRGKKEIEHGLLHRLDNDACGLLVIASTQQSYDALYESQRKGSFEKTYSVVCLLNKNNPAELGGFPPVPGGRNIASGGRFTAESAFRPFGAGRGQVRPVTSESGTAACRKGGNIIYRTEIEIVSIEDTTVAARCRITAGYRHQVRCHLAWVGLPVLGDRLYNFRCGNERTMQFEGSSLCFPHPLTGERTIFTVRDRT